MESRKVKIKALLFLCQELSRDIECQIKGVVILLFPLEIAEGRLNLNRTFVQVLETISQNITPVRLAAFHICVRPNPWLRLGTSLALQVLPKETKDVPEGTEEDIKYARENLYHLAERGRDALEDLLELANQSQHPRAFEVVGQLVKTLSDTNKDLLEYID